MKWKLESLARGTELKGGSRDVNDVNIDIDVPENEED
jgi:hypothetical protein